MKSIRAGLKMVLFALLSLGIIPPQRTIMLFTKGTASYAIPCFWHRNICRAFGIKFETVGTPSLDRQTLFMCNHLSYLDIPLIGSIIKASFVAKSDVSSWPVFGFLADLQQTAYMQRKKTAIAQEAKTLQGRIAAGKSLIIFPEGTSTDGQSVLPFKSSLFSLALNTTQKDLLVQPMTLQLLEVDGRPVRTQEDRDLYTWHLNMQTELPEHLWRFALTSGAKLRLTFHPPLQAAAFEDRKVLAKTCHDNVSKGLEAHQAA